MGRKPLSKEEFTERFEAYSKSEYELLDEYTKASVRVKIRHKNCGREFETLPTHFITGKHGCKECFVKSRIDSTSFLREIENRKSEYECVGEYTGRKTKIKIKHIKCGNVFEMMPNTFVSGSNCPKCAIESRNKKRTKTHDYFVEEIKNLVGNEYEVISEYTKSSDEIVFKHNVCGKTYSTKASYFISGNRCPHCYGTPKKTTSEFRKEVFELSNSEYELLSEYKTALTKVLLKHNKCGKTFKSRPNDFISGYKCPYCNSSKGEKIIEEFLENNGYSYSTQYKIKECRHKLPLPFDFSVNQTNKEIILIEYDGITHYRKIEYFGGEHQFELQKKRDGIKNKFCEERNIKLIRIPYWEKENIEEILKKELSTP